jgi:hypothetical protein
MIKKKEQKLAMEYRKQKELEGCTFKPKINSKTGSLSVHNSSLGFLDRQNQWVDLKNNKREMLSEAS